MCGLLGGLWEGKVPDLNERISSALLCLRTRGPDDHGHEFFPVGGRLLALGHTRLSIIDLSTAGHQPMHSPGRKLSMVFNGEIYNYRELRSELKGLGHQFVSDSDTEVLLAAWQQWGAAVLSRLVGMFAFVVYDRSANTLTCVRDAFGIKPFFYATESGNFLFASEIPAIQKLKQQRAELNWQRAYDYLVHGDYDSSAATFMSNVFHLKPGHLMTVDVQTGVMAEPQQWWKPQIIERSELTFSDATAELRDRFLSNIRLHLRSDVSLGAALSGGIDSSAVVCAMRHVEPDLPINTFSYIARDEGKSEEIWVDRINAHVGAKAHKVVVSAAELAKDLDDMIRAQGEPFNSTSIYAQYRVFKLAQENGVTVTLDGQGADEMLAGYNGYPGQRLRSLLDQHQYKQAWHFLDEWSKWPGRNKADAVKRAIGEMTDGPLYSILRQLTGKPTTPAWINARPLEDCGVNMHYPRCRPSQNLPGRRVIAELGLALTERGIPALLRHGDRNSMRFSVESRVPFLTTDLANFLLSLPEHYLISPQGETKHVFRAAMRGIVPDDVLDRRDKIGFETPEQDWLLSMADTIRSWLKEDLHLPFFNQEQVISEFELIVSGKKAFSWQVWRWINFSRWYSCTFS